MARAHYADHYLDAEGRPITGASVYLYDQGTTTPIGETIYTVDDSVGNTSTTNPITTDSSGKFEFYLDDEVRLDLKFVATGKQDVTRTVDVLKPGAAGGASAIDDLSDVTITAAASGDFLRHNGTAWVDATISEADIPAAIARDTEVTTAISDHSADTTSVHGIADTSVLETTTGAQTKVDTHVNDATAAHAATAIAFTPAGTIAATTVQAAIEEVASEAGGGGATDLDDLTDVVITAAASGEYIRHNGTNWVDATIQEGDIPSAIARDTEVLLQTLADAKGDLPVASAADTWSRVAAGTDMQILQARAGATNGLEWVAKAHPATVDTDQSTTSASFADLTTTGPAVTVTTGSTVLVIIACNTYNSTSPTSSAIGVAVSGATTTAAADSRALNIALPNLSSASGCTMFPLTVTPGSNTFTMKYKTSGGTANFRFRHIAVVVL